MNNELNVTPNLSNSLKLPINETIKEAWTNTRGFKGKCWLSILILMIVGIGTEILSHAVSPGGLEGLLAQYAHPPAPLNLSPSGLIIQIIGKFIYYLLVFGLVYMAIRRTKNLPISMGMFFSTFKYPRYFQIIGWYLIKFLLVIACIIPLYIPSLLAIFLPHTNLLKLITGILYLFGLILVLVGVIYYIALRLSMTTFAILDKGLNPIAAMKLSYSATKGNALRIFAIYLMILLFILISIIPLGIGLIWSIPFAYLVYPAIYRRLVGITTNA